VKAAVCATTQPGQGIGKIPCSLMVAGYHLRGSQAVGFISLFVIVHLLTCLDILDAGVPPKKFSDRR
jgi:hypothetical protein